MSLFWIIYFFLNPESAGSANSPTIKCISDAVDPPSAVPNVFEKIKLRNQLHRTFLELVKGYSEFFGDVEVTLKNGTKLRGKVTEIFTAGPGMFLRLLDSHGTQKEIKIADINIELPTSLMHKAQMALDQFKATSDNPWWSKKNISQLNRDLLQIPTQSKAQIKLIHDLFSEIETNYNTGEVGTLLSLLWRLRNNPKAELIPVEYKQSATPDIKDGNEWVEVKTLHPELKDGETFLEKLAARIEKADHQFTSYSSFLAGGGQGRCARPDLRTIEIHLQNFKNTDINILNLVQTTTRELAQKFKTGNRADLHTNRVRFFYGQNEILRIDIQNGSKFDISYPSFGALTF